MKLPPGLRILIVVFLIAAALSIVMLFKGTPTAPRYNPLKGETDKINKITLDATVNKVALESKEKTWRVTAPVDDVADKQLTQRLLDAFQDFSLTSTVSENPKHYPDFGVSDGSPHLRVYESGKAQPVFDVYVGRQAEGFNSAYVRLSDRPSVYVADDLPSYLFQKSSDDFREHHLLVSKPDGWTRLVFASGSWQVSLKKSSTSWTNEATGMPLEFSTMTFILSRLPSLMGMRFAAPELTTSQAGFDKPFLTISVDSSGGNAKVVVGDKVPNTDPKAAVFRYTETEGRKAILEATEQSFQDLIKTAKSVR